MSDPDLVERLREMHDAAVEWRKFHSFDPDVPPASAPTWMSDAACRIGELEAALDDLFGISHFMLGNQLEATADDMKQWARALERAEQALRAGYEPLEPDR